MLGKQMYQYVSDRQLSLFYINIEKQEVNLNITTQHCH